MNHRLLLHGTYLIINVLPSFKTKKQRTGNLERFQIASVSGHFQGDWRKIIKPNILPVYDLEAL